MSRRQPGRFTPSRLCRLCHIRFALKGGCDALGNLLCRPGVGAQCRARPRREHAAGVLAPGGLGLRRVRHRCDGSDAGAGRAGGGRGGQPPGRLARCACSDAPVLVGRRGVHCPGRAAAQLPLVAAAAPDDRHVADRGVHPRRKLDQPTGGRAMARTAGGAVWQQLCPEPAGRAAGAGFPRLGRRLRFLGSDRPAAGCAFDFAGSGRGANHRGVQRDLQ